MTTDTFVISLHCRPPYFDSPKPSRRNHVLSVCTLTILVALMAAAGGFAQTDAQRAAQRAAAQAAGRQQALPIPTGEAKRPVAVTVWLLTLVDAALPEADELEGALREKADDLPVTVGGRDAVRDLIARLKMAGMLQNVRETRLLALDGENVQSTSSFEQPTIIGTTTTEAGLLNTIQMRHVGTIVQALPSINSDSSVNLKISYESNHIEMPENVVIAEPQGKKPIFAPLIVATNFQSVLQLKSGNAVVVWTDSERDATSNEAAGKTKLLIVAAEIMQPE